MTRCLGCMSEYEEQNTTCPHCGYSNDTPPAEALHMNPGSILNDRYVVGKVLGFGGFGVTYIGWDALLEQAVAIKEYLPSELSTRMPGQTQVSVFSDKKQEQFQDGLDKFLDEAQRLAQFHNAEGIVRIFDSIEANGTAYIIMEYLDGETLKTYLKENGTFSPEDAVDMLMPVMESLRIVHAAGIIHRDIAPDNIFLTRDGRVKLIDFGSARFATAADDEGRTVIIKGGYSPEEQYSTRGEQGAWTDVYAIAATLYEMITGKRPPEALDRRAAVEKKKKDLLKPLSGQCKEITENQEAAILNALNVRREDRSPDMQTLIRELTSDSPVKLRSGNIKRASRFGWPLWAKIAVPAVASIFLILTILLATGIIGFDAGLMTMINVPEGMTRVPSVVSDTITRADERLRDVGMKYTIVGKEPTADIASDLVLTQSLNAGTVAPKTVPLEITISAPAEEDLPTAPEGKAAVPDIQYYKAEQAKEKLEEQGLAVDIQYAPSETVAAGVVVQQPDDEVADENSTIQIVVSSGSSEQTADADEKVVLRSGGIALRTAPDTFGRRLSSIPRGTVVRVLFSFAKWAFVQFEEHYGWVRAADLGDEASLLESNSRSGKRLNGYGEKEYPEGIYKGNFVNGKREGHGEITYTQAQPFWAGMSYDNYNVGDVYSGEWKNDLRDGPGTLTRVNGGKLEANFRAGKLHGAYKAIDVYGTTSSSGQFENGKLVGKLELFYYGHDGAYGYTTMEYNADGTARKRYTCHTDRYWYDWWGGQYEYTEEVESYDAKGRVAKLRTTQKYEYERRDETGITEYFYRDNGTLLRAKGNRTRSDGTTYEHEQHYNERGQYERGDQTEKEPGGITRSWTDTSFYDENNRHIRTEHHQTSSDGSKSDTVWYYNAYGQEERGEETYYDPDGRKHTGNWTMHYDTNGRPIKRDHHWSDSDGSSSNETTYCNARGQEERGERSGTYSDGQKYTENWTMHFDDNGRRARRVTNRQDSYSTSVSTDYYNNYWEIDYSETVYTHSDGTRSTSKTVYQYDSNGRQTRNDHYNDGVMTGYSILQNGEWKHYNADGTPQQ